MAVAAVDQLALLAELHAAGEVTDRMVDRITSGRCCICGAKPHAELTKPNGLVVRVCKQHFLHRPRRMAIPKSRNAR